MIDTVSLNLYYNSFTISNYNIFNDSELARKIMKDFYIDYGKSGCIITPANPSKKQQKEGIYLPYLTLIRSKKRKRNPVEMDNILLKVRFSAPKLLFGNNFDELEDVDIDALVDKLHTSLNDTLGIIVDRQSILEARVSEIHCGKNIIFEDGTQCDFILENIKKADISRRLDLNESQYRNSGHGLKYHANSYEVSFYDKVKDLKQAKGSDKRAFEEDNAIQLDLLDNLINSNISTFRMECRLNKSEQIERFLGKVGINVLKLPKSHEIEYFQEDIGYDESNILTNKELREQSKTKHGMVELTLKDLFSKNISQKICLHFWKMIEDKLPSILLQKNDPLELFYQFSAKGYSQKDAGFYAFTTILSEDKGQRKLRDIFDTYWLKKILNAMDLIENKESYAYNTLLKIRKSLEIFDSVKLDEYKISRSNKDKK